LISIGDDPVAGCDGGFGALLWRHKEGGKAQEKEGKKEGDEGPSAPAMEKDGGGWAKGWAARAAGTAREGRWATATAGE
jgi:hypothetical protein